MVPKKNRRVILAFCLLGSLFTSCLLFYLGYTEGPGQVEFASVKGAVQDYEVFSIAGDPVASVAIEGQDITFRATADYYEALGLNDRQLNAGETVELVYDADGKGRFYEEMKDRIYAIVEIHTDSWSASVRQQYLEDADGFSKLLFGLGVFAAVLGICGSLFLWYVFKRKETGGQPNRRITSP